MTGRDSRRECVSSNVDWYASVSRAHGLEGAIEHGVWTCRASMPPYYSNAVTVSPSGSDAQLAHLHDLVDAVGHAFTVKDSHTLLDLPRSASGSSSRRSGSGSRTTRRPAGARTPLRAGGAWRHPRSSSASRTHGAPTAHPRRPGSSFRRCSPTSRWNSSRPSVGARSSPASLRTAPRRSSGSRTSSRRGRTSTRSSQAQWRRFACPRRTCRSSGTTAARRSREHDGRASGAAGRCGSGCGRPEARLHG